MKEHTFDTWDKFRSFLSEYAKIPVDQRNQFIFRGQSNSNWELKTSLDRKRQFSSEKEREKFIDNLVREFRHEANGLTSENIPRADPDIELLGRHHGLYTPLLDWTQSPYYAAFFAFNSQVLTNNSHVSIWMLDRSIFEDESEKGKGNLSEIKIIDDDLSIALNQRAIEQRGLFLRIGGNGKSVENILNYADSLTKMNISSSEYNNVLSDLDEMGINSRTLFRDLDSAAKTANQRIFFNEEI